MHMNPSHELISRKYADVFGATARPSYAEWIGTDCRAALGFRRANTGPLFLEAYLDNPIEKLVSAALARKVKRTAIVEIGNFAAENAIAMVELWGSAANDLGGTSEIAVATLTAPLRRMFARIGVPIAVLAPARPERLGKAAAQWGRYYASDPMICMGLIAEGQDAIASFLARRSRRVAA